LAKCTLERLAGLFVMAYLDSDGESKPRCINCNTCIFKAIRQGPLHCMQEAMLNRKPA
jgi:hypothetical protein